LSKIMGETQTPDPQPQTPWVTFLVMSQVTLSCFIADL
jgi:hypothetical protein